MATQTEVTTETSTQDPNSSHWSQEPHKLGFSTYTPEGNWQRGSHNRQNSESPSRNPFQGEGRVLRPSSAPPNPQDQKERSGTPGAPRIPITQLPTPYPTGPRRRQTNPRPESNELRNEETLDTEFQSIHPGYEPAAYSYVPESVMEEARVHEMLTETTPDPRSPQSQRTPIPSVPPERQSIYVEPARQSTAEYEMRVPRNSPRGSPHSSNGSIRILQPLEPRDQVRIPTYPGGSGPLPPIETRTYQSQYESAMGSALDRDRPATNSSQPKRYPTPHDALEDVGEQCRRMGETLGIRGLNQMQLEDHIQAVRALAEAREIDLPIWIASQTREPDINRELNRLYAIVWQPDVSLIVPEDASLPDPWGLTRKQPSPENVSPSWSWQQLEQQRAFEHERERWRENMAREVRRRASIVVNEREGGSNNQGWERNNSPPEPIPRPLNPAVPSTTIYPPSSNTSERMGPRIRIIEPSLEEQRESENTYQHRDVPSHQVPMPNLLKPGNVRPEGYKYTPYHRTSNTEPALRQSRRRLREILEDVEGERNGDNVGTRASKSTFENRPLDSDSSQHIPISHAPPNCTSIQSEKTTRSGNEHEMTDDERRIQNWEQRGNKRENVKQGNLPGSSEESQTPPNPPPPPSSPPPPPPPPPSPPPNGENHEDSYNSSLEITKMIL
ncbi:hypothetical protein K435DRAFT_869391 [Dendrothele bispora CBS 962.96]|uniref:Uncharacterized protein n=1 Tax=Dendrothele bispora (strain CBS 962.96) TaxID=1314807 RepID=A0A4S8L9F9_DENBC|nr:hypothetical protein K435DRAFT_869391 [Dendrothele bispora CBS 962.96]